MTSQNIVDNTYINGTLQTGVTASLPLNADGNIWIFVGGYFGWGFDLNMTSSAASGTLSLYTQYTNPNGDTFIGAPTSTFTITSGQFANNLTRQTIDSNNVTTKGWVIITWVGTDTSNGNVAVVGVQNIF